MGLFSRRPTTSLPLQKGERVLAVADVGESTQVVATSTRLAVVSEDATWQRRWVEVDSASWSDEERELEVRDVAGGGTTVHLPDDDHLALARVVRERVQSTLVTWRSVPVPGGQVRVAVRKDGDELVLQEVPDAGADTTGEQAQHDVRLARRELAASVGLHDVG
jgi:hypothetical protein